MTLKTLEYVTDNKGKKKAVMMSIADFERMQEDFENLQDIIAMERARKNPGGFRLFRDFLKELDAQKKVR